MKKKEEDPPWSRPSDSAGTAIPYPCCPREKVVAFPGTHGRSSVKCPNCGKYAVFDYDAMLSEPGKACRGATNRSGSID